MDLGLAVDKKHSCEARERIEETHFDSKSKILMEEAVAAHSQYRLGEKTKELTISPASRE